MFQQGFYNNNDFIGNVINNNKYEQERNGFFGRSKSFEPRDLIHRTTPLKKSLPKGLANIGATCYMNATLQCFYHCKKLTKYLIEDRYKYNNISIPYNSITSEYIKLVKELSYKNGQKDYAPYDFKDVLGAKNPLFHGIAANDSKDLILFLLEELSKELAIQKNNNFFASNNKDFVDQTNEEETFRETVKDFAKGTSIIKDIFYFMVKTTSICKNCNAKLYNFQVMNFIIFPLSKTYEDSKNMNNSLALNNMIANMNNNMNNNFSNPLMNMNRNNMMNMNMNNMMNMNMNFNQINNNINPRFKSMNSMNNMNSNIMDSNMNNNLMLSANNLSHINLQNKMNMNSNNNFNDRNLINMPNFLSNNNNFNINNNFNNNFNNYIKKDKKEEINNFRKETKRVNTNRNFSNNVENFFFGNNKNNFNRNNNNFNNNFNNNNFNNNFNNNNFNNNFNNNNFNNNNFNNNNNFKNNNFNNNNFNNNFNNNNFNNNFMNNNFYGQRNNYHNRSNSGSPILLLGSGGGGPYDTLLYGNKSNKIQGPKITLDQCFESFLKPDYLTGDNKQFCNKCRVLSDALYSTNIYSSPNILILILNYGKGKLFQCDVQFDEFINISKFIEAKDRNLPTRYRLLGSIVHIGPSSMGGHFIAFCRGVENPEKWYKLNDSLVSEATFSEIKNVGIPYVLFYENVNKY